jgi:hypothetical protein
VPGDDPVGSAAFDVPSPLESSAAGACIETAARSTGLEDAGLSACAFGGAALAAVLEVPRTTGNDSTGRGFISLSAALATFSVGVGGK